MSKSQRMRIRDYRRIYELVGQCRELGADPLAWREHLQNAARDVFGSQIAIYTESDRVAEPGTRDWLRIRLHLDSGWPCESDRRAMFRLYETGHPDCEGSPFTSEIADSPRLLKVGCRRDALDDRRWYRGFFYNEFMKPAHMDDAIMMRHRLGDEIRLLVLQRANNDVAFELRQIRMLRLLGVELAREFNQSLAARGGFSVADLAPRLRQVLIGLLEGDSEKQVALRLSLSQHTVHDYVKSLHKRFQVQSRGELLSRCQPYLRSLQAMQRKH
ncbi:MAG: LuxR C-terminal-related transcriptional regulator [bacterium]|nr:LuxR C-terminal-related transcriptional regulator [bacterium]